MRQGRNGVRKYANKLKIKYMATITFTKTLNMNVTHCPNCHIPFAISEEHEKELRESHKSFFCPNGHSQYYSQDNEAEKLRKELRRKEQELADTSIEKIQLRND